MQNRKTGENPIAEGLPIRPYRTSSLIGSLDQGNTGELLVTIRPVAHARHYELRYAAAPAASSIDSCEDATTGTPLAIASTIGIPKPSNRDG